MVKTLLFLWIVSVLMSAFPLSNPLNIVFYIIMISSFLFFFFSLKGGSAMGFLWVLVYMGGMLIVFLYLIFLTYKEEDLSESFYIWEEIPLLVWFLITLFSLLFKMFFSGIFYPSPPSLSFESQEFYSLIFSVSCGPIFAFLLSVISVSLVLFLSVLGKKMFQNKISIFFHFIMK